MILYFFVSIAFLNAMLSVHIQLLKVDHYVSGSYIKREILLIFNGNLPLVRFYFKKKGFLDFLIVWQVVQKSSYLGHFLGRVVVYYFIDIV